MQEHKLTYVSMHGIPEAEKQVEVHSERAEMLLSEVGMGDGFLMELIGRLVGRDK